jgi:hypothetical protein
LDDSRFLTSFRHSRHDFFRDFAEGGRKYVWHHVTRPNSASPLPDHGLTCRGIKCLREPSWFCKGKRAWDMVLVLGNGNTSTRADCSRKPATSLLSRNKQDEGPGMQRYACGVTRPSPRRDCGLRAFLKTARRLIGECGSATPTFARRRAGDTSSARCRCICRTQQALGELARKNTSIGALT